MPGGAWGTVVTLCLGSGFAESRNDRLTKATQPMKSYEFESSWGGFAGRRGIYSTLYNGGRGCQQGENCVKGQLTVRICEVTLQ